MKEIPTWHERAMAHPDHQSGMVSEEMLRARMGEEIADLRAEVERLRGALREATLAAHGCAQCRDEIGRICREALEDKP